MHSDSNFKYGRSESVTEELRLSPLLPPAKAVVSSDIPSPKNLEQKGYDFS